MNVNPYPRSGVTTDRPLLWGVGQGESRSTFCSAPPSLFWINTMKKLLILLFVFIPISAHAELIACLGDSVTLGYRVDPQDAWCYQLGQQPHIKTINYGESQSTTDGGLFKVLPIASLKPSKVLIMFGLNDAFIDTNQTAPRVSLNDYRNNLILMIRVFKKSKIEPILMTSNATANYYFNAEMRPYILVVRELAKKAHIKLVDNYQAFAEADAENQDLYADYMHPNNVGHTLILQNILEVLK